MTQKALIIVPVLVLAAMVSAAQAEPKNQIQVFMINAGIDSDARGRFMFVENKAQAFFHIRASRLDPGASYDIMLNSVVVETVTANPDGEIKVKHRVRFKGKNAGGTLPFDPRGGELSIQATGAGVDMLFAAIPNTPAEAQQRIEITFDLVNMGVVSGTATGTVRSRFGRMKLDVVVTGAPAGTYDLVVDGADVGDITVDASGNGRVEFDSRPCCDDGDSGMEELLTFDPRGKEHKVMQAIPVVADLFSGTCPLVP
jgi:hypothetical protein